MTETTVQFTIPAEDLTRQYALIADEVQAAIAEVLPRGKYTMGPQLTAFEQEFAAYCGATACVGISSGTAALHLALAALGVGPGDEVITAANTYAATAFAVTYLGATPVFVDIEPRTFCMDPTRVEEAISERTRVILVVHLYGHVADMDAICEVARRHRLTVVEDAAQAHGAAFKGRRAGSFGALACFSFYPGKNLGAYGDGGAITVNRPELEARVRQLRYMGQRVKHEHEILGYQERLDELQAAILRVKLRHLEEFNTARCRWAAFYDELLHDTPVVTPHVAPQVLHSYYMYTVRAPRRDELREHLQRQGIGTQVIYPKLVPDQGAYRTHPYRSGDLREARAAATEILCLPIFPELTEEEVRSVAETIRGFYASGV